MELTRTGAIAASLLIHSVAFAALLTHTGGHTRNDAASVSFSFQGTILETSPTPPPDEPIAPTLPLIEFAPAAAESPSQFEPTLPPAAGPVTAPQSHSVARDARQRAAGGRSSGRASGTYVAPRYLESPPPPYPNDARRKGLEGTVILRVTLDELGRPVRIFVARSSGTASLDQVAVRSVRQWKFAPARA